jgi:photosystem II stability/assembly factor-like uncharacterized protein
VHEALEVVVPLEIPEQRVFRSKATRKRDSFNSAFADTLLPAIGLVLIAAVAALAQTVPPQTFSALEWRFIGPYRGGRVVAVTGISGDMRAAYFGAVGGGIWKSPNVGITWEPMFDGQPVASIGAIAIAPSDPNIIYVGTGESDIRSDLSSGDGVYKSADGGKSWTNLGLRDSRQISRIVVDPLNPDIVFVAALGHAYGPNDQRGVFKSTDGGKTWSKVLYKGLEIGASDLTIASGNSNVLFAGMWHAARPPWSTYPPVEGPGSGLYRSTDGGATWTELIGHGLPDGQWGRVGVAIAPDGNRVYSLIEAAKKSGLYRSDDGGNNWTLANADSRLTSRAWYFNWLTIDPGNPDVVYIPNVALYRSDDGGKTISIVRGAPGGDDYHDIWVDPKNPAHLILGTDQGTTISLDRGKTWSSWYNQPTAQMYHVTTDDQFPYIVYGAQQDIGSIAVPSRTNHQQITPRDPFLVGGGESGYIVIDPSDPNILYATGTYGSAVRFDRRTSLSQNISPWPATNFGTEIVARKYRDPWTPMLTKSTIEKGVLYMGTQYVLRSSDGGLHWSEISPDLTGAAGPAAMKQEGAPTIQNAKERGYGVVFSIAPSPLDAELIWTGSDTGLLHMTRDGGKSWQNVTPAGLSDWSKISTIEASHFRPEVAYAAVDRHRLDDYTPHLYRTRDYGKTWRPITNGIASNVFVNAVRQDPQKPNLLFAGTEQGVYVSFDEGDRWQPLQLNLPAASARDLNIHGDDLVVATHGRGFWILDNITPLRQVSSETVSQPSVLFAPATAVRVDNDVFLGTPLPPEVPTAKNPPDGAMIDYYLNSGAHEVTLDIYDSKNALVRHITSVGKPPAYPPLPIAERWLPQPSQLGTKPGMHRYVWDLRWGGAESEGGAGEEEYRAPHPPRVAPGIYSVKLTVDGKSYKQPFKITMDPRSSATPEMLQQQLQLAQEIYGQAQQARTALREVEAVSKKLAVLKPEVESKHPELLSQLVAVQSSANEIKNGTSEPSGSISGLSASSSGLASALSVVESGDRPAPAQALEVYHLSADAAKNSLAEWQKLQSGALAQLNQALQAKGFGTSKSQTPQ